LGEVCRFTATPIVQKDVARRLLYHVVMDGDDVDSRTTKALQHCLQFVLLAHEVSVHDGVVIRAAEAGPSINAHLLSDLAPTLHLRYTTEHELHHSILLLRLGCECFS